MTSTTDQTILPTDTKLAIEKMIVITQETIASYEAESNAIALGGELEFLQTTESKQALGGLYQRAAQEFMVRQGEFLAHGGDRLGDLAMLQKQLGSSARTNMSILKPICDRLQDNHKASTA